MKTKTNYETINTLFYNKFTHKICASYKGIHLTAPSTRYTMIRNFVEAVKGHSSWLQSDVLQSAALQMRLILKQYDTSDYRLHIGYPHLFVLYTSNQNLIDQVMEYVRSHRKLYIHTIYQPHEQLEQLSKEEEEVDVKVRVLNRLPDDRFIYTVDIKPVLGKGAVKSWAEGNEQSIKCSPTGKNLLMEWIEPRYYNIVRVHVDNISALMLLKLTSPQSIMRVYKNVVPKVETSAEKV